MKRVLLYSGGWDSFCVSKIYPDAKKIYVNLHTPYSDVEMQQLPKDVEIQDLNLQKYVLADNYHIPQRNAILALIANASIMAEAEKDNDDIEIYICGVKEDSTAPDKSPRYFKQLSKIASLFNVDGKAFSATVKGFFNYDKIDLWNMAGKPDMRHIISCYTGNNCGTCLACKRRLLYLDYIYPGEYIIDKSSIIKELEGNNWIISKKILERK